VNVAEIARYAARFPPKAEDVLALEASMVRTANVADGLRESCRDFALRMAAAGHRPGWFVAEDIVLLSDGRLWRVEREGATGRSADAIAVEEASDWWLHLRQVEITEAVAEGRR
jgi:hypothetical protein